MTPLHFVIITERDDRVTGICLAAQLVARGCRASRGSWSQAVDCTEAQIALVATSGGDPLVSLVEQLWAHRDIPVVLMTDDAALTANAYEAGVAAVVRKDSPIDALIGVSRVAIERERRGAHARVRGICRLDGALRTYVTADDAGSDHLEPVVAEVAALFDANVASIMLYERPGPDAPLVLAAQIGHGASPVAAPDGVAARVAKRQQSRILLRAAQRDTGLVDVAQRPELSASMCVPIPSTGGRPRGVMNVATTRPGAVFTPHDLSVLDSVAGLVGDAIAVVEGRRLTSSLTLQIEAAERLSTLGELAGGIVHEVANPMTCVRANVDELIRSLTDLLPHLAQLEAAPDVEAILDDLPRLACETWEGIERTTEVVREMKAMMRPGAGATKSRIALGELVESTVRLLRPRIASHVTVRVIDDVVIDGSRTELARAIVNLVVNASDACDERPVSPGYRPAIVVELTAKDGHAVLSVSDNGAGIPAAMVERIFQPLFTTKTGERGTGLGLPLVRRVAESHGGVVDVASEQGAGTTFRIQLPAAAATSFPAVG